MCSIRKCVCGELNDQRDYVAQDHLFGEWQISVLNLSRTDFKPVSFLLLSSERRLQEINDRKSEAVGARWSEGPTETKMAPD